MTMVFSSSYVSTPDGSLSRVSSVSWSRRRYDSTWARRSCQRACRRSTRRRLTSECESSTANGTTSSENSETIERVVFVRLSRSTSDESLRSSARCTSVRILVRSLPESERTLQDSPEVRQHLFADPFVPNEFGQRDGSLNADGQVVVGDAVHEEVECVLKGLREIVSAGRGKGGDLDARLGLPKSCRRSRTFRQRRRHGTAGDRAAT